MTLSPVDSHHFINEAIDLIYQSRTKKECYDNFEKIIKNAGYTDFSHIYLDPKLSVEEALYTTTSKSWQKSYMEFNYQHHDPVLVAGMQTVVPILWSDLENKRGLFKNMNLTKKSLEVMNLAKDFKYQDGVTISVHSGKKALITCYVNTETKEQADKIILETSHKISVLMLHMHEALNRMSETPVVTRLTPRQAEILSWVAAGKTNQEISIITGLSKDTVSSHLRSAMSKLDVHTRAQAAAKALHAGIIT